MTDKREGEKDGQVDKKGREENKMNGNLHPEVHFSTYAISSIRA